MTVSFFISIYEKSYEAILNNNYLNSVVEKFNYEFEDKIIIINNVNNYDEVVAYIQNNYSEWKYFKIDEDSQNILKSFNLSREQIEIGYVYSIANYYGIYYCNSDYLLHVTEDCYLEHIDSKFMEESLKILNERDDIISAMPSWEKNMIGAKTECLEEIDNFYKCLTFTDQVYLIKMKEFKKDIYNFWHDDSNKYPKYGGESFDKRINSYMWSNNKYRIVHKNSYYNHDSNFNRNS